MKLFSFVLTRKIDKLTFPVALSRYALWSIVRLGLLNFVVIYKVVPVGFIERAMHFPPEFGQ